MRKFVTAVFAGALALAPLATVANAQSGYDTGTGKSDGATANSGQARPDSTTNRGAMPNAGAAMDSPNSEGANRTGSASARPDADPNSRSSGGVKASEPSRATSTDTRN